MGNKLASSHLTSSHLHLPSVQTAARELSPGTNPLGESRQRWCGHGGGLGAQMNLLYLHSIERSAVLDITWVQPQLGYINYADLCVASRIVLNTADWGLTSYYKLLHAVCFTLAPLCFNYKMQVNLMKNHFTIPVETYIMFDAQLLLLLYLMISFFHKDTHYYIPILLL